MFDHLLPVPLRNSCLVFCTRLAGETIKSFELRREEELEEWARGRHYVMIAATSGFFALAGGERAYFGN